MTYNELFTLLITDTTLHLLVIALGIFTILAIKSRSIRSFQFQLSIFIIIWIGGEILHVIGTSNFLPYPNLDQLSPIIHTMSMISISLVFLLRYIYVKKDEKKFIADIENQD
jgi:hypothetical protein